MAESFQENDSGMSYTPALQRRLSANPALWSLLGQVFFPSQSLRAVSFCWYYELYAKSNRFVKCFFVCAQDVKNVAFFLHLILIFRALCAIIWSVAAGVVQWQNVSFPSWTRGFDSPHLLQIRTKVMIPLVLQLSFFFFLQKSLFHKPFRLFYIKDKFQRGKFLPLFALWKTVKKTELRT